MKRKGHEIQKNKRKLKEKQNLTRAQENRYPRKPDP